METTALSLGKSVLDGALGYAKSAVAEEVALQLGVQRDHAFVREELEMMRAFLKTAHDERDDHQVLMTWVKQVRDVAYDAEIASKTVPFISRSRRGGAALVHCGSGAT
jgi:protein-tyrosine phosphatase